MKRSIMEGCLAAAPLALLVVGCGGGGGSTGAPPVQAPAPTPTPTPSPTPSPSPAAPVSEVARIFANPTLTPDFFVTGGGWVSDTASGLLSLTTIDASNFGFVWDTALGGYQIASVDFGSGLLMRVSDYFAAPPGYGNIYEARPSVPVSGASYQYMTAMETRRADDPYDYVTVFDPSVQIDRADKSRRTSWVWIGAAQPTPAGAIPTAGKVRYKGDLAATLLGNFGDQVAGKVALEIDLATGRVEGTMDVVLACFMGCTYPVTRFTIDGGTLDRSTGTIGARVRSVTDGEMSGRFAGPDGEEALLRVKLTYHDPERKRDVDAMGVVILRRE